MGGEDEKMRGEKEGGEEREGKKGKAGRREIKERKKGSVPESFSQILAPDYQYTAVCFSAPL